MTTEDLKFRGYTVEELQEIWSRIANPIDWKSPVCVKTTGDMVAPVIAAIIFFTATIPVVNLNVETMSYYITSEGYRAGPAGDH